MKISKLGDVLSKEVYCNSKILLTGVWAIFRNFLEKKAVFTPLNHISHVFSASFESTRLLTFESQLKKLSCSVLLLFAI